MRIDEALNEILKELERAEVIHPQWPMATLDQVAIMVEEAGESLRAALNYKYHNGDIVEVKKEVIQTGAMAIRVLKYLSVPKEKSYLRQTLDSIEEIATYHGGEK